MKKNKIVLLLILLLLTSCQAFKHKQFKILSLEKQEILLSGIKNIAERNKMTNKTSSSQIRNTLAYYTYGERTYFDIGLRIINNNIVIDLSFRSYSIFSDEAKMFKEINNEINIFLKKHYDNNYESSDNIENYKIIPLFDE